ncbi:MAG: NAD(P)-binding protein [Halobacteriales archaeon]|nr:NAD(P)-binding protein [Halobacteriales archaeon]
MPEVGVVGAGAGAAAASYVLDATVPEASITVLEKSGGLCGRAATRRRGEITYDYGANYVKSDDERVTRLLTEELDTTGLIDVTEPIYTFDESGTVSEGRDADEHKWSYRSGLTQIAKRLFGRTDTTIHRRTRVETIRRSEGQWGCVDTDGEDWGPFDVLLLNPPAPQTAELLATADWETSLRADLVRAIEAVEYRTIWTAILGYTHTLERPYYALVNTDKNHDVGWIAREECKPGHVPDGESVLIVQASPEWSTDRYDADPEQNIVDLAGMTAEIMNDDRLREPAWTDHQGWRYALPETGTNQGVLADAEEVGLYCLGDWVAGEARLHAALRNGLETGERIAYAL